MVAADNAPVTVTASAMTMKAVNTIASLIPLPRANPMRLAASQPKIEPATYQVASASLQDSLVIGKPIPVPAEPKRETPSDIISARGFWGDVTSPDKSASNAAMPQTVTRALAYAPPTPQPDRGKVIAASAPVPPLPKLASALVHPLTAQAATAADSRSGVATMAHLTASDRADELWTRAMILAPSVTRSLSSTLMGDHDVTAMRAHFAKPDTAVAMTFSSDPAMGMVCERFTGPAVTPLTTTSFRTAALR